MQKGSARLLVAMAVVVVAGLLVVLSQLGGGGSQESFTGIPQDGTKLGREDAPLTIRLYEDFQCPACGQFARETLQEVPRGRGVGYGVVAAGAKEKLRRGVGLRPAEELFVIRAICQWCMANVAAVIAYLVFGTVRLRLAGSDALKTADRR